MPVSSTSLPPRQPVEMLIGGLVTRRVRVPAREVVFIKGVIEASEGLAVVFADHGGDLTIATLPSQETELDNMLRDLAGETGALLDSERAPSTSSTVEAPHGNLHDRST